MGILLNYILASLLLTLWLVQVQTSSIDYRYKRRGPPPPPRPPPVPTYMKKWESHRPTRGSARPRPIPMQAVSNFIPPTPISAPIGPPINIQVRPTLVTVRNPWKITKAPYHPVSKKPFYSSPPIHTNTREYDFHIQSNTIPSHPIMIKQLDEKGPIHTIPAPNLSIADKPPAFEDRRKENKFSVQQPQSNSLLQAHQYQVIEHNDSFNKHLSSHLRKQQVQNYKVNPSPPQNVFTNEQTYPRLPQLNNNEVYQFINSQPQQQVVPQQIQQHEISDHYEVSLMPQGYLQAQQSQQQISFPEYHSVVGQSQSLQGDASYVNQIQSLLSNINVKNDNHAHFPTFTAERHSNFGNDNDQSTFITTDYNFKAEAPYEARVKETVQPNRNLPYIQETLSAKGENIASQNNIEQNINPEQTEDKNEESISSAFYTTLPNKQAAETLASLQAAGKINNNNIHDYVQFSQEPLHATNFNQKTPLEIYVPDNIGNEGLSAQNKNSNKVQNDSKRADDGLGEKSTEGIEEDLIEYQSQSRNLFGNRIRPKISY